MTASTVPRTSVKAAAKNVSWMLVQKAPSTSYCANSAEKPERKSSTGHLPWRGMAHRFGAVERKGSARPRRLMTSGAGVRRRRVEVRVGLVAGALGVLGHELLPGAVLDHRRDRVVDLLTAVGVLGQAYAVLLLGE